MSYLTIISLEDAKTYLAIDDTARDTEITRMIKGALSYIERFTNHIFFARNRTYIADDGCVNVYDYPINSVVSVFDYSSTIKALHTSYDISENSSITLNVGYASVEDVPEDLIEVAYEILDLYYFSPETGKNIKGELSQLSKDVLNNYKRFI